MKECGRVGQEFNWEDPKGKKDLSNQDY